MGQLTQTTATIQAILNRIFRRDTENTITGIYNDVLAGTYNIVSQECSIAAGNDNIVDAFAARGLNASYSGSFGSHNKVLGYCSFTIGTGNLSDSLISQAIGTGNVAGGYDSVAMGVGCKTGRRQYTIIAHGVDSLHGLGGGDKAFALISPDEGDVTGWFPNVVVEEDPHRSLAFDLHPYCVLITDEELGLQYLILKSTYTAGVGTKVWYDSATDLNKTYILGANAGFLPEGGGSWKGMIAGGYESNSAALGAIALGIEPKAWGAGSLALGLYTKAIGYGSLALGTESKVIKAGTMGFSSGKITNIGDAQIETYTVSAHYDNPQDLVALSFYTKDDDISTYTVEMIVTARETALDSSFCMSYKFEGLINNKVGACDVYGMAGVKSMNRTIIARNVRTTGDFVGDGLPIVGEYATHGVGFYFYSDYDEAGSVRELYFPALYGSWSVICKVQLTKVQ